MRRTLAFEETGPGVFTASLALTAAASAAPVRLHLDGVATGYRLLVNGTTLAEGTSMWARSTVALDSGLRPGENRLELHCRPLAELVEEVPRAPRARWRTRLVDEGRLRWVRTSLLGLMPGLPTGDPVRGPWRPVVVQTEEPVVVEDLRLRARLEGEDGELEVTVRVSGADRVSVSCFGRVGEVVLDEAGTGSVRLREPGVRRWWPHTHGEPALHEVVVTHDGEELERRRVGFRALVNRDPGSVDLEVNGVPVFVRGAVWTPGDLRALDRAVELGLNMVRVPGWATYESRAFWERCDELGLLVWQDLDVRQPRLPAGRRRLRRRGGFGGRAGGRPARRAPEPAVVCGASEVEQQAAMFGRRPDDGAAGELAAFLGAVLASAPDAVWVDSSPTGGALPFRPDAGVSNWFGVGAYPRPLSSARTDGVRFASECLAFANPSRAVLPTPRRCGPPAGCRATTAPTGTSPTPPSSTPASTG